MTEHRGRILVVDDEGSMRDFLTICLRRAGHTCEAAAGGAEALKRIDNEEWDVVLTDLTMPQVSGMDVLRHAVALPNPPLVIMMTAYASTNTAVEAMKTGAYDYLIKPFNVDEIQLVMQRALERQSLRSENRRLREQLRGAASLEGMAGRSESMLRVFGLITKLAPTRTGVLIRGESGTGKELVARALHNLSERSGPFVAVNCGAIPENLMESELFGHKKGAFTGASTVREGVFVAAQGGTLFLDEVGELSLAMQVKLLRALQEKRVRPVGGDHEVEVDARVIAATNRNLEAAIEAGEFRQDLYFRLNVVPIVLPPLRHRSEDIPLLVERIFTKLNAEMGGRLRAVSPEAMDRLLRYHYPGNIRELENLIERAIALEGSDVLTAEHLPCATQVDSAVEASQAALNAMELNLDRAVADLERQLITTALRKTGGVRKDAATVLGITFRSLRYRLEKLGIEVPRGERDGDDDAA